MPYQEKPYNRCIDCEHIGVDCDGPDFLAMDIPRLCEWAKLRKEHLRHTDPKWTMTYIADKSGVGKSTVERFINGRIDDLDFTTAARIIRVLVNGSWGKYPCTMAAGMEYNELLKFKRLLSAGVISQEEFDAKKRQVLGL